MRTRGGEGHISGGEFEGQITAWLDITFVKPLFKPLLAKNSEEFSANGAENTGVGGETEMVLPEKQKPWLASNLFPSLSF